MPNSDPKLEKLLRAIIAGVGRRTTDPLIEWNENKASFKIQVSAFDQGRFIGKGGTAFWALSTIFWYAGLSQIQRTVGIELMEPEGPKQRPILFRTNPKWDRFIIAEIMDQVLDNCFKGQVFSWEFNEPEPAKVSVIIRLTKYLQTPTAEPNFSEAIDILIHAAGKADGCTIKTTIEWA